MHTSEIVEQRRPSAYQPVAQPKRGKQLELGTEWTDDRRRENDYINEVRSNVRTWREAGYPSITRTTRQLLDYWTRAGRDRRLFFCQLEAVETAIYLTEAAQKLGRPHLLTMLRQANAAANPGLDRLAFKMATGSGKTVVMAMLIAWHALNKIENPQDARFSDSFLIVTPGITIRDRARWCAHDGENTTGARRRSRRAHAAPESRPIVVTNFHTFLLHETASAGRLTSGCSPAARAPVRSPRPDQMVRRVCREFGNKKNVASMTGASLLPGQAGRAA